MRMRFTKLWMMNLFFLFFFGIYILHRPKPQLLGSYAPITIQLKSSIELFIVLDY